MKSNILRSYAFNLSYARKLVEDVDEKLMAHSPGPGLENHPAFTLGHLCSAAAMTSRYLDGPYQFEPSWEPLFRRKGPGDPRLPESKLDVYPPKSKLMDKLEELHALVDELIHDMSENRFNDPVQWRFDSMYPTTGDLLFFMCVTHEAMHLGQLAAWRRAMGMDSALAKL